MQTHPHNFLTRAPLAAWQAGERVGGAGEGRSHTTAGLETEAWSFASGIGSKWRRWERLVWGTPALIPAFSPEEKVNRPPFRAGFGMRLQSPGLVSPGQGRGFFGRSTAGFTLIELLVVIGVIGVLTGMVLPALARIKLQGKIQQTKVEMKNLGAAIIAYESTYSRFPAKATGATDLTFGYSTGVAGITANSEVLSILMDVNAGANLNHALNARQVLFFSAQPVGDTVSPGFSTVDNQLRDPWGQPYVISMDLDGDKRCRDAFYSTSVSQATGKQGLNGLTDHGNGFFELDGPVMIWSLGPDGKYDNSPTAKANAGANRDNILSWQ